MMPHSECPGAPPSTSGAPPSPPSTPASGFCSSSPWPSTSTATGCWNVIPVYPTTGTDESTSPCVPATSCSTPCSTSATSPRARSTCSPSSPPSASPWRSSSPPSPVSRYPGTNFILCISTLSLTQGRELVEELF